MTDNDTPVIPPIPTPDEIRSLIIQLNRSASQYELANMPELATMLRSTGKVLANLRTHALLYQTKLDEIVAINDRVIVPDGDLNGYENDAISLIIGVIDR